VGTNAGPPASAAAVRYVNRAVAKRDMMQFPQFAKLRDYSCSKRDR
jgi:hypothetical protein